MSHTTDSKITDIKHTIESISHITNIMLFYLL